MVSPEFGPGKIFILVGDTQKTSLWEFWRERNDRERRLIIDEICRHEPAFVVHLGDLIAYGSSKRDWDDFDELNRELRRKDIPYFPILGNHEYYGRKETALQYYFDRFPYLEQRRWYSFHWKNVGLLMVDSNFSKLTSGEVEEQSQWYLDELGRFEEIENVSFVIVCCHHPPFTNSKVVRPNEKVKTRFVDPFLRHSKTRLFFSGHTHSYERFEFEGKFFIVSGGGGGPRHKLFTAPGSRRFEDIFTGPKIRFFHFIELETNHEGLTSRTFELQSERKFRIVDPFTTE